MNLIRGAFFILLTAATISHAGEADKKIDPTDGTASSADQRRLEKVAERGRQIMPFDPEKTAHGFSKTSNGGLQQIVAKDADQIRLIRMHLYEIAQDFQRGDFSEPEWIHGSDMPGLAKLQSAKPGEIRVEYSELPDGGQIRYATQSPTLVHAIHDWLDAQIRDHAGFVISRRGEIRDHDDMHHHHP